MISSMTGYGRGRAEGEGRQLMVELRSVNHRFCDVVIRGCRELAFLDAEARKVIQSSIKRGRIEVQLTLRKMEDDPGQVKVDKSLALAYYKALRELSEIIDQPIGVRALDVALLPDVLRLDDDELTQDLWPVYESALQEAVHELVAMRRREGEGQKEAIRSHMNELEQQRQVIAAREGQVVVEYQQRLKQRIDELLGDQRFDEERLEQEVAILAERSSIAEELSRLDSHCQQLLSLIDTGGGIGRKLEFLLQEMNREVNTIGSKSGDVEIAKAVVAAKSELEKMREQAQNIE